MNRHNGIDPPIFGYGKTEGRAHIDYDPERGQFYKDKIFGDGDKVKLGPLVLSGEGLINIGMGKPIPAKQLAYYLMTGRQVYHTDIEWVPCREWGHVWANLKLKDGVEL